MSSDIIGFIAVAMTTGSLVPQIIKMYNTKDVSAISLSTYIMYLVGILIWIVYGVQLNSIPVHVSNFFSLIFSLSIITMKIRYGKKT